MSEKVEKPKTKKKRPPKKAPRGQTPPTNNTDGETKPEGMDTTLVEEGSLVGSIEGSLDGSFDEGSLAEGSIESLDSSVVEEGVIEDIPLWKKRSKRTGGLLDRITTCDKNGQFNVDIAQLELDEWPQELLIVAKVKTIVAFKNKLTFVPSLQDFRLLEYLDLSRNKLTSIDSIEFFHLVKLKHLDVSRNRLEKLPEDITKCPVLERLIVHRNRLIGFPTEMNNLRLLRFIDASYNNISHVGLELEMLSNLEELNLGHNDTLEKGNMSTGHMGINARRLCDKRSLLSSKEERRALITRALGLRKHVLLKEQQVVMEEIRILKEEAEKRDGMGL